MSIYASGRRRKIIHACQYTRFSLFLENVRHEKRQGSLCRATGAPVSLQNGMNFIQTADCITSFLMSGKFYLAAIRCV